MLIDTFVDVTVAPVREGFCEDLGEYTGATSWAALNSGEASVGTQKTDPAFTLTPKHDLTYPYMDRFELFLAGL